MKLILASKSEIRKTVLENAGLEFECQTATLNERLAIEEIGGEDSFSPHELALILADLKAKNISDQNKDCLIIGADQVLGFEGKIIHKAKSLDEARDRLKAFSDKTHHLYSGISLVLNGDIIWHQVSTSSMVVRELSDDFIEAYLQKAGERILSSVGCYQLENLGAQLFKKIEGDFFSILGLPLLPLLSALRENDIEC